MAKSFLHKILKRGSRNGVHVPTPSSPDFHTDDIRTKTHHEHAPAVEEDFVAVHTALPTNPEKQAWTDKELTERDQSLEKTRDPGLFSSPTHAGEHVQTNKESIPTGQGPQESPRLADSLTRTNFQTIKEPTATGQGPPESPGSADSLTPTNVHTIKESTATGQEPRESPGLADSLTQINGERHSREDKEKPRALQGPLQVTEKSSATVNVEDLRTDDVVIAVMGPTGSGKSTFIHCASGLETQGVGHTLKSFTSQVNAIRFRDQESGRHIVLVDTPGFDDTFKSDLDILSMISDWLNSSYKKEKLLSGILYLHRITDNRMAGTPLKNLRVFRKLCGKDALGKVYLTTTMWDEVEQSVGEKRLEELRTEYWKAMITQGAQIACCRSDDDSPKKLIQYILTQEGDRMVELQREMAELKMGLKETAAGQELYSQLEELVRKQTELLRRIGKERKAASDPRVLEDLQSEYDELQARIDDKLRQMDELKLPRLKGLFQRIFSFGRD